MKKFFILDYIGLTLLIISFSYFGHNAYQLFQGPMLELSSDWLDLQQSFYLAALSLGYLTFFTNIRLIILAPVALLVGHTLAYNNIFDDYVHVFFINAKIYTSIGFPNFVSNPQYSKLIFFILIIGLLLTRAMVKKYRKLDVFFVLFLLFANLGSVIVYHKVIPAGLMKFENEEDLKIINKMSSLKENEFKSNCFVLDFHCKINKSGKIYSTNAIQMDDERKIKYDFLNQALIQQQEVSFVETNEMPGIYSVLPVSASLFYEVYSFKRFEQRWEMSKGYFSMVTWIVSFFWFFTTVALSFLHRKVKIS